MNGLLCAAMCVIFEYFLLQNSGWPLHGWVFVGSGSAGSVDAEAVPFRDIGILISVVGFAEPVRMIRVCSEVVKVVELSSDVEEDDR